ncbi:HEAT repeat protein [Treponema pedis]
MSTKHQTKPAADKMNEKEIMTALKAITKDKTHWQTAVDSVAFYLDGKSSSDVKAKALWLLGEMGLAYPAQVQKYVNRIAGYLEDENPKLRERAVNALGRIGRADKTLVIPYLNTMMKMSEDAADNVRLAFVWACENIATNAPEIFCERLELFYRLMQDKSERVRIEAPEMFRVMGKRKPEYVLPYLEKLQRFAAHDGNTVVRIHSAGAIRITKKHWR